jgi:murein DD-endopeptidase MepM/ murein hydrolase activator NlpD
MKSAAWLVAVFVAGTPALLVAGEPVRVAVRPGGVARWHGEGTTACSNGHRVWEPLGATCYYPVDLEATGTIAVARVRAGVSEGALLVVGGYPYPEQHLTVDDRMVHLSKADLERTRRESAQVGRLWELQTRPRFTLPLAAPLPGTVAGGNFGARRVFNGEPRSPHSGIDYKVAAGTPVLAVAAGRVVLVGDHFFAGKSVYVDHGGGLISMVFHLSRVLVEEGQAVATGHVLGKVGATGRATGPHLHLGFRWHGARVDPAVLLDGGAAFAVIP